MSDYSYNIDAENDAKNNEIWVNSLSWSSSLMELNYGLWDNNSRIAIHWPIFCDTIGLPPESKASKYFDSFFVTYEKNSILIDPLPVLYYEPTLQDIVFTKPVWIGLNKSSIYTTISLS